MKTSINLVSGFNLSDRDLIMKASESGFDAFFPCWKDNEALNEWILASKDFSIPIQSIHAPFGYMSDIWEPGENGDFAEKDLIKCLEACNTANTPIMIAHAFIGFGEQHPTDIGIEHIIHILDRAHQLGVKVAFENTEGEKYLEYIIEKLFWHDSIGFCIDTGHEQCYNRGKDIISLYKNKLIALHLNDNEGVTGDEITFYDDAHMLPFDGIVDWQNVAKRVINSGFSSYLTFELNKDSRKNRHTHDKYINWDCGEFYRQSYQRALKVAELFKQDGFTQTI